MDESVIIVCANGDCRVHSKLLEQLPNLDQAFGLECSTTYNGQPMDGLALFFGPEPATWEARNPTLRKWRGAREGLTQALWLRLVAWAREHRADLHGVRLLNQTKGSQHRVKVELWCRSPRAPAREAAQQVFAPWPGVAETQLAAEATPDPLPDSTPSRSSQ